MYLRAGRAGPGGRLTGWMCALLMAIVLLSTAGSVRATTEEQWGAVVGRYLLNPYRNRGRLRGLRHGADLDVAPATVRMALADAELRGKHYGRARAWFRSALEVGAEEPLASWARLGLAWAALAQDDAAEARAEFQRVAEAGTSSAPLGAFGAALLDATDRVADAEAALHKVARTEGASADVRQAAELGAAYARYWVGDLTEARRQFEAFAARPDVDALRDDARYAAAWTQFREGDRSGAVEALTTLAARVRRAPSVPAELGNLEPHALLRSGMERYRRGPFRAPENQVVEVLNVEGEELAWAALRTIGRDEPAPDPPVWSTVRGRNASEVSGVVASARPGAEERWGRSTVPTSRPAPGGAWLAVLGSLTVMILAWSVTSAWRRR